MIFRLFHPSVLDKPHLLRQAGSLRCTAQGCMERHCQGCSTIFHPIGVQAIADDYHVRLFFVGKWGMWRKRDEQKWQNWINMALSTSLLEVSVERSWTTTWRNTILNLLWVQVPEREPVWNLTVHWWIDGRWDSEVESDTRHLNLVLGNLQAWKLCATSGTCYGPALPFFCLSGFHIRFHGNTPVLSCEISLPIEFLLPKQLRKELGFHCDAMIQWLQFKRADDLDALKAKHMMISKQFNSLKHP